MENSDTHVQRRKINSTVYVAKSASGDNNASLLRIGIQNDTGGTGADVANREFPRRDSVLDIKNAFEKVVKSTRSCSQRDSVGGKLREVLINKKVGNSDKISTGDNSQCSSTLQSHIVNTANSKSQI